MVTRTGALLFRVGMGGPGAATVRSMSSREFTEDEQASFLAAVMGWRTPLTPDQEQAWARVQVQLATGADADVEAIWAATGADHFVTPEQVFGVAVTVVPFIPYPMVAFMSDGHLLGCQSTVDLLEADAGNTTLRWFRSAEPGVYTLDEQTHVASLVDQVIVLASYPEGIDPADLRPAPTVQSG